MACAGYLFTFTLLKKVILHPLMQRFTGLIGIVLILGVAFLFSNNKRKVNIRLVISGLALQVFIAILVFKVPFVNQAFQSLGKGMEKIEGFAKQGANFVFGGLLAQDYAGAAVNFSAAGTFVFAINVTATIILVTVLVAVLYYLGIMQRIVAAIARAMNFVMRVSGAEALSNVASAFVGQVEAQVMIRPYLPTMTRSELLASMSGSLACIAGGILIVYANMGARAGMDIAPQLIAASLMAAPGALVISKIVFPETEPSQTMGKVKMEVKSGYSNLIDAISHGAGDGFKIASNVIAMLIGFIALIAMLDWLLLKLGGLWGMGEAVRFTLPYLNGDALSFQVPATPPLSLNYIFSKIFYPFAWAMGIPGQDVANAATLLGQKITINEFVAFKSLTDKTVPVLTQKGLTIVTVAICGFANFSSVGMQIGGIGALAPERRTDLARLGMKALLCGTLASYLSATIAGMLF